MQFGVLGPLEVDGGARGINRPAHRRLLTILLLEAGRVLDTDELIDRFWRGDPPASARTALQTHISALRRQLPTGLITTAGTGYVVHLDGHLLDAHEADRHATSAAAALDAGDHAGALVAAESALALYRGRPYSELTDDDFARPEAVRLEELRLRLVEDRAGLLIELGRDGEVVTDLEAAVLEHPLRERLWRHLMLARHRQGRTAEALRAYQDAGVALAEAGLEPGAELRATEARILQAEPVIEETGDRPRHNLPTSLTSFVGRERELAALTELLDDARLVTLTGAGGVGKTRLVTELGHRVIDRFPDGVWLVSLAPLSRPELVVAQLATVLGLHPERHGVEEALRRSVRGRDMLVVLDNCEHLVDAAAGAAELLLGAGLRARVLATSREVLRVPGETVFRVPPLTVDRATEPVPAAADGSGPDAEDHPGHATDAVTLFADRAARADGGFELSEAMTPVVADICRRLDGLPLAIELAAARVNAFAPDELARRLDDRFRLLTENARSAPRHHQTLEAALAWGHESLEPAERAVFDRLGVFRGSFALTEAEAVCGDDGHQPGDVAALVASLVDKSMVATVESRAGRRYRLLETMRHYALARLRETGRLDHYRHRHVDVFAGLASRLAVEGRTEGQLDAFNTFIEDLDNFRAAFSRAEEAGRHEIVVGLCADLMRFLEQAGHFAEAWSWFQSAPKDDDTVPTELRVRALSNAVLVGISREPQTAHAAANEAVALAEAAGLRPALLAEALAWQSHVRYYRHEDGWFEASERAVELARESGDEWTVATALQMYGHQQMFSADASAFDTLLDARERFRRIGDRLQESHVLWYLALATNVLGCRHEEGLAWSEEGAELARRSGSRLIEIHARQQGGHARIRLGDRVGGHTNEREMLQALQEIGDLWCTTITHRRLALLELRGDPGLAASHIAEAIRLGQEMQMTDHVAACLNVAGKVVHRVGHPVDAVVLFAAAEALLVEPDAWYHERERLPDFDQVRDELPPNEYAAAWRRGRALSLEDAAALALDRLDAGTRAAPTRPGLGAASV